MPDPKPFGRRVSPPPVAPDDEPEGQRPLALDPFDPRALSAEAEAFRAQLAAAPPPKFAFSEWRRSHRGGRLLTWGLTLAFIAPGAICFAFDAPPPVSIGVEITGLVANAWLRRVRRQRLREIAAWEEPED